MGAWEYGGTVGNCYSFAHATYGANPFAKTHISGPNIFSSLLVFTFRALGVERPYGGAISSSVAVACP